VLLAFGSRLLERRSSHMTFWSWDGLVLFFRRTYLFFLIAVCVAVVAESPSNPSQRHVVGVVLCCPTCLLLLGEVSPCCPAGGDSPKKINIGPPIENHGRQAKTTRGRLDEVVMASTGLRTLARLARRPAPLASAGARRNAASNLKPVDQVREERAFCTPSCVLRVCV